MRRPRPTAGGKARSSTRSIRAASPTRTVTASATSTASSSGSITCGDRCVPRRRRHLAVADVPAPAARLRLRHQRLHRRRGRVRDAADLDALIAACHERGMRILMDLVPCHTSVEHPWFVEGRSSRDERSKRDWYIWADPAPGRRSAVELERGVRRGILGVGRDHRPVLPPQLLSRAAGPELAQPGGGRSDRRCDALLVRPRRRWLPGRRHLRRHQGRAAARQPS